MIPDNLPREFVKYLAPDELLSLRMTAEVEDWPGFASRFTIACRRIWRYSPESHELLRQMFTDGGITFLHIDGDVIE